MGGRMDGWTDGRTDGRTDERTDGRKDGSLYFVTKAAMFKFAQKCTFTGLVAANET